MKAPGTSAGFPFWPIRNGVIPKGHVRYRDGEDAKRENPELEYVPSVDFGELCLQNGVREGLGVLARIRAAGSNVSQLESIQADCRELWG